MNPPRRGPLLKALVAAAILSAVVNNASRSGPGGYLGRYLPSVGVDYDGASSAASTSGASRPAADAAEDACRLVSSSLENVPSWPPVTYHKDLARLGGENVFVSAAEDADDPEARAAVDAFNELRPDVLTRGLLEAGYSHGGRRAAGMLARRFLEAASTSSSSRGIGSTGTGGTTRARERSGENGRPLVIAVFGNSFTIGSNCGESFFQGDEECAWPARLGRRVEEFLRGELSPPSRAQGGNSTQSKSGGGRFGGGGDGRSPKNVVRWRMLQSNGQNSGVIAQMIPRVLHEFRLRNETPDAVILDNTISDKMFTAPWFEAVVRALIKSFPDAVIVSLVSGVNFLVDWHGNEDKGGGGGGGMYGWFPKRLGRVQEHYGLTVIDVAKMVHLLRNDESYSRRLMQNPAILRYLNAISDRGDNANGPPNSDGKLPDLLWPQSTRMASSDRRPLGDREADAAFIDGRVYFDDFLPRVRKTKPAHYPNNHPPWPTHQYVADAVMYGLLRVLHRGLACEGEVDEVEDAGNSSSTFPVNERGENSVSPKAELDNCFVCLDPVARIDARSHHVVANLNSAGNANTSTSIMSKVDDNNSTVAVTCGDWRWVTDSRNRSGWQSDRHGSVIRFRMKVTKMPTISVTYLKSYETFGDLRVTFRPAGLEDRPLGCGDFDKPDGGSDAILPSITLEGKAHSFSLWETVVFPREPYDVGRSRTYWDLLNRTVLGHLAGGDGAEYVDLYVENPNEDPGRSRIKIQTVTSC